MLMGRKTKTPIQQSGWLALTLQSNGEWPPTKDEEFPALPGTAGKSIAAEIPLRNITYARPAHAARNLSNSKEVEKKGVRQEDIDILLSAFPAAAVDIVQACLEEAKGDLHVAANYLAEVYGGDSREGLSIVDTDIDPTHVNPSNSEINADELSPDEYLIWEQEQLLKQDVYLSHRKEAIVETRAWQRAANRAKAAYRRGDGAAAKAYSLEASQRRAAALALHADAGARILDANNGGQGLGIWEMDLHGLHVREAIPAVENRLTKLRLTEGGGRGRQFRVIVGSGNHSLDGEHRLGPALLAHFEKTPAYRVQQSGPHLFLHVPYGDPGQRPRAPNPGRGH
eukprot:jgi/Botrbrau1/19873/Bobra.0663s0001.1